MKTIGIIAEFNPFHKGHKYLIEKAKEKTNADNVVVIMSGSFVQRGEASIFSKWERAKCALLNGANLVIELPFLYASQSAEYFAKGGVEILDKIGITDYLAFGGECDNEEAFNDLAEKLLSEKTNEKIKAELEKGLSYPKARYIALNENPILETPNNILALEYLCALKKLNSKIKPIIIKRSNFSHDGFGSASYIRECIKNKKNFDEFVPENCIDIYKNSKIIFNDEIFSSMVLYKIRTMSLEELKNIREVSEGLEYSFKKYATTAKNAQELLDCIKSKRYTMSRLRRTLINILLNVTNETKNYDCNYVRILGADEKGFKLINKIKEKSDLNIITKLPKKLSEMMEFDIISTDIASLLGENKAGGEDYKISPIVIK